MYHSLIQILAAAKLISRSTGATVKELAEHASVSERTVYRIIASLEELGYPVWLDRERGNRYRLCERDGSWLWAVPVPSLSFDLEDRVLMDFLFERAAKDPAIAPAVKELRRKISLLGAAAGQAFARKEAGAGPQSKTPSILSSSMPPKTCPDGARIVLPILLKAIEERRRCVVNYESRETGDRKTYPIDPLAAFENEGGIYCFVVVPAYGSVRILALERILSLEPTDERFKPPADFDAQTRLGDPFGIVQGEPTEVRLAVSQDQAPYLRDREWPPGFCFSDLPDGRLGMEFITGGIFGLMRWILGWGGAIEILEPEWLRTEIAEEAVKILENNRKNCTSP